MNKKKMMGGEAEEMQLGGPKRRRRVNARRRRRATRRLGRSMNKGNKGGKCTGPGCGAYRQKGGEYIEQSKELQFGGPSKPDFADIDGDGNKKESMKSAAKQKKVPGSIKRAAKKTAKGKANVEKGMTMLGESITAIKIVGIAAIIFGTVALSLADMR